MNNPIVKYDETYLNDSTLLSKVLREQLPLFGYDPDSDRGISPTIYSKIYQFIMGSKCRRQILEHSNTAIRALMTSISMFSDQCVDSRQLLRIIDEILHSFEKSTLLSLKIDDVNESPKLQKVEQDPAQPSIENMVTIKNSEDIHVVLQNIVNYDHCTMIHPFHVHEFNILAYNQIVKLLPLHVTDVVTIAQSLAAIVDICGVLDLHKEDIIAVFTKLSNVFTSGIIGKRASLPINDIGCGDFKYEGELYIYLIQEINKEDQLTDRFTVLCMVSDFFRFLRLPGISKKFVQLLLKKIFNLKDLSQDTLKLHFDHIYNDIKIIRNIEYINPSDQDVGSVVFLETDDKKRAVNILLEKMQDYIDTSDVHDIDLESFILNPVEWKFLQTNGLDVFMEFFIGYLCQYCKEERASMLENDMSYVISKIKEIMDPKNGNIYPLLPNYYFSAIKKDDEINEHAIVKILSTPGQLVTEKDNVENCKVQTLLSDERYRAVDILLEQMSNYRKNGHHNTILETFLKDDSVWESLRSTGTDIFLEFFIGLLCKQHKMKREDFVKKGLEGVIREISSLTNEISSEFSELMPNYIFAKKNPIENDLK